MEKTKDRHQRMIIYGLVLILMGVALHLISFSRVPLTLLGALYGGGGGLTLSSLWVLLNKRALKRTAILEGDERERFIRLKASQTAFRVLIFGVFAYVIWQSSSPNTDEPFIVLIGLVLLALLIEVVVTYILRKKG